ncbi:MAG: 16S rRNA (uracil(1498)-N(3))-methyltransferase [Flavobacteriaceae bacterium]|nr:16S rRNA (uracil(1498)-N(3))-methyltransferase [Flavobacteriaceae bacterium]
MQLFYNPNLNSKTKEFTFDKEESKHVVRVLRKKEGDKIQLTNGKGVLFNGYILAANDKKCAVAIVSFDKQKKAWNYYLHIAIAPAKMNDRFAWFIEKATEIGIDEITPIICDNSERKILKLERMEKVMVSAMKQSLKCQLPKLNKSISFSDFIQKDISGTKFIAHCENTDKKFLNKKNISSTNITIIIGPEGDFSPKEISKALQHQFIPLSLGESRLRTETAGIVACNTIGVLKNNWQ